jgi:hypothetical protein
MRICVVVEIDISGNARENAKTSGQMSTEFANRLPRAGQKVANVTSISTLLTVFNLFSKTANQEGSPGFVY